MLRLNESNDFEVKYRYILNEKVLFRDNTQFL